VFGAGFQPGATVTLDGAATNVKVVTSGLITATTPIHVAGTVDVVVTNPGGQSARLQEGYTYAALAITGVLPAAGLIGDSVRIVGNGFGTGTRVTFGGQPATIIEATPTMVSVIAPAHAAGAVDLVFTTGVETISRPEGFNYLAVTLSPSAETVVAGASVSVSWTAPAGRPPGDWVTLLKVGAPNTSYRWLEYTNGARSGTVTLNAPAEAGQYEFRYLVDDSFIDAARSVPVTILASLSSLAVTGRER
jgi:hypothetical protein